MLARSTPARTRKSLLILSALLALVFVGAGVVKLIPIEFERSNFMHFGYPMWFMVLIGFVEIAGGLLLLSRKTRSAGALLDAAVMVGAVTSHLRAGDGIGMATPAFILLVLFLVVAVASGSALRDAMTLRLASRSA